MRRLAEFPFKCDLQASSHISVTIFQREIYSGEEKDRTVLVLPDLPTPPSPNTMILNGVSELSFILSSRLYNTRSLCHGERNSRNGDNGFSVPVGVNPLCTQRIRVVLSSPNCAAFHVLHSQVLFVFLKGVEFCSQCVNKTQLAKRYLVRDGAMACFGSV